MEEKKERRQARIEVWKSAHSWGWRDSDGNEGQMSRGNPGDPTTEAEVRSIARAIRAEAATTARG